MTQRLWKWSIAVAVLLPATAMADWGENWGEMIWGATAAPPGEPVPTLGTMGLMLLAGGLAVAGTRMLNTEEE